MYKATEKQQLICQQFIYGLDLREQNKNRSAAECLDHLKTWHNLTRWQFALLLNGTDNISVLMV